MVSINGRAATKLLSASPPTIPFDGGFPSAIIVGLSLPMIAAASAVMTVAGAAMPQM